MTDTIDRIAEELPRGSETILAVDDENQTAGAGQGITRITGLPCIDCEQWQGGPGTTGRTSHHLTVVQRHSHAGGMNGYELVEQATEYRSDLKVLLTSGYAENAN